MMETLRSADCGSRCDDADARVAGAGASSIKVVAFEAAVRRVAQRAGCSFDDAIDLLMDHADAAGRSLGEVAREVLEDRVRFDT